MVRRSLTVAPFFVGKEPPQYFRSTAYLHNNYYFVYLCQMKNLPICIQALLDNRRVWYNGQKQRPR